MLDWTELRDFLAVAEGGSFSAGARTLGTSQPTVGRRISALEDRLGSPLFIRARTGLQLTELGESLLEHAKRMEREVNSIELMTAGQQTGLKGKVTISVIEAVGSSWMTDALAGFHAANPEIEIEMTIDHNTSDIMRREADIAVRMYEPRQLDLIGRKIGSLGYGFYASNDYIARNGAPEKLAELAEHDFVMPSENLIRYVKDKLGDDHWWGRTAFVSNSMMTLIAATNSGFGIGVHSFLLASRFPNLVRILPKLVPIEFDFWLVTHPDLRRSPRVRAVWNFLSELFRHNRAFLSQGGDPVEVDVLAAAE